MDRKIYSIVLGAILVVGFFLPFFQFFGQGISGYDMVFSGGGNGGDWEKYLLLLFPVSGIMLLWGALNKDNYILGRALWAVLPLLTYLYIFIAKPVINGAAIGDVFKAFGKGYGIGLWLILVASVVLAVYHPKQKA